MKIALFYNLPNGGAKKVVYNQIQELSRHETVDVYTIESNEKDFLGFSQFSKNTTIYPYHKYISPRIRNDFQDLTEYRILHKRIACDIDLKKYDIVIAHSDRYTQAPYLLSYLKTPSVYYCHELLRIAYEDQFALPNSLPLLHVLYEKMNRGIRKKIDASNIKGATKVLTNSHFTKETIQKYIHLSAITSYPGVDTKVFFPKKTKKEYDIVFIGEKSLLEGYDLLDESLSYFEKQPLVKIVSNRETGKWITDSMLANEYRKAKVVVALSRNEPFGLIPLEAMACGIPVIAVNEGGFCETVSNSKTGYLIPRDPKILYKKLDYLLQNSLLCEEMGKCGAKTVQTQWNNEKRTKELLVTLRKTASI